MDLDRYWKCRQEGAFWPLKQRFLARFTGADRVRYLNGQVTQDVTKLKTGQSLYAAILNPKGKMCADLFLAQHEDAVYVDATSLLTEALTVRLEKYIIADDVTMEVLSDRFFLIHAWGTACEHITGYLFKSSNNRLGFDGVDFYYDSNPPSFNLTECTDEIANIMELEAGIPRWGAELTDHTLPPEAGIDERWIRYDKGCYVGQETIARIKSIGHVNRLMVGLIRRDGKELEAGTEIQGTAGVVGKITRAAFSPLLEKGIALGYVQRQYAAAGTILFADKAEIEVVSLPFIKT